MFFKPLRQLFARHLACGKAEHQSLLFIDRRHDLVPIQDQKDFHRGVSDTLVAVDKRVIQSKGKTERRRFCWQRSMKVTTAAR
jgi:hypothetical protein